VTSLKLTICSGTPHKLEELQTLFPGFELDLLSRPDFPSEDGATYGDNARIKARYGRLTGASDRWMLADDSGIEVAALGVGASGRDARRRAERLLEALGLSGRADETAAALPHGDERKLGVARALATEPRFVLMDEPAAGLTEAEVPELAAVVRSVRDEHDAGVLLIDHNVPLIMEVCDRVHVLDQGRTLAQGTPAEIRDNIDVANAYLGGSGRPEEAQGV